MNHVITEEIYLQWLQLRYKHLLPSEEVISLLESLRKKYYLAVISNGESTSQWEKLTRLHLIPYFDCILISGDLPWEKPNKQIFFEACTHLGVRPEECIMVGDKLETDILGAGKAGLAASVWIPLKEPGFVHVARDIIPDYTIEDMVDLLHILSGDVQKKSVFCPEFEDCNSNSSDGS